MRKRIALVLLGLVVYACTFTLTLNYRRTVERNKYETQRAVECDPRQECEDEKKAASGGGLGEVTK